jgi:hypothetical protein
MEADEDERRRARGGRNELRAHVQVLGERRRAEENGRREGKVEEVRQAEEPRSKRHGFVASFLPFLKSINTPGDFLE